MPFVQQTPFTALATRLAKVTPKGTATITTVGITEDDAICIEQVRANCILKP